MANSADPEQTAPSLFAQLSLTTYNHYGTYHFKSFEPVYSLFSLFLQKILFLFQHLSLSLTPLQITVENTVKLFNFASINFRVSLACPISYNEVLHFRSNLF